jgi:hypothetical protein
MGSAFGSRTVAAGRCKSVVKTVQGQKKRIRICRKPVLPQAGMVAKTISLPQGVRIRALAVSDKYVFALDRDRHLFRVDTTTSEVTGSLQLPESEWPESNVVYADGAVWVTVASPDTARQPESDSLLRIDPFTERVIRIHVGHSPIGIAITPGFVWTANHRGELAADGNPTGDFDISRVDTTSNSEVGRLRVERRPLTTGCCGPSEMTAAAGSIWITDPQEKGSGQVIRIDPANGAVNAVISFASANTSACGNVVGDDVAVWVQSGCDGREVTRINPQSNRIVKKLSLGAIVQSVALGNGSLWATTNDPRGGSSTALDRINPSTNKLIGRTRLKTPSSEDGGAGPLPLAISAGSIWVASDNKLIRIAPR